MGGGWEHGREMGAWEGDGSVRGRWELVKMYVDSWTGGGWGWGVVGGGNREFGV